MRRGALSLIRAALLTGPAVLGFFSGGFFGEARLAALAVAAVALAVVALGAHRPLPARPAGWIAIGALALYALWIALSSRWAPVAGRAIDDAERAVLYAVVLAVGVAAWRSRRAARRVEPALAGGIVVVIGYGLAGRLLPGIVTESHQASAAGRLDQPLTYWNAVGALAAIGLVLCTRLAGDTARRAAVRVAGAAAAAPLGMGLYLTFSRGALAACLAGLLVLGLLACGQPQLRAGGVTVTAALLGALAAAPSSAVRTLAGGMHVREHEGLLVLAALLVVTAGAVAAAAAIGRAERAGRLGTTAIAVPRTGRIALVAAIAGLLVVPLVIAGGKGEARAPVTGATAERFASVGSNRYAYWSVALRAWADHPVRGVGASGFQNQWLAHRHIDEVVRDAHSLEIETLAELGIVGIALLALLFGGVARAGAAAQRADPALCAGLVAGLCVWAFHSAIDWDWEMPALTLVAVVLAGALLSRTEAGAAQFGEERALTAQRARAEEREEEHHLGERLRGGPVAAPQHEA